MAKQFNLTTTTVFRKVVEKSVSKLKVGVLGLFYGLCFSMPTLAQDIEIYLNSSSVDSSIQPNVLFLLDTSWSMGKPAQNVIAYDATDNYTDRARYPSTIFACFDDTVIYRLESGDAKIKARNYCDSGGTNNDVIGRVNFNKFFCDDAAMIEQNAGNQQEAADSPGFYTGKVGRYRKNASNNSNRWGQINNTSTQVVECKADSGLHGVLAGNAAVYATKHGGKDGGARWSSVEADEYEWSNLNTKTVYTGNYLNYLVVTDSVDSYRIQVIRDAMIAFVETAADINLGLMPFSKKRINGGGSQGGMIEVAVDDITNTREDIIRRLKVYGTQHDVTNTGITRGHKNLVFGTPSARQYYEALRYFKGNTPVYGLNSRAPGINASITDDPDGDGSQTTPTEVVDFPSVAASLDGSGNYKSPIANECQQNYVILLSDGLPYSDPIQPSQLTEMGISDTSCTVDPNCVTKHCDSTCLPSFAEAAALLDNVGGNLVQPISTFTIGFGLDPNTDRGQRAIRALHDSAAISKSITNKGESFLANNADELRTHLRSIVEVLGSNETFSSPAVSVNAFNRTVHLDDLFFTLFEPNNTPHWAGNFKKYKLSIRKDTAGDPVLDSNGRKIPVIVDSSDPPIEAIDPGTGFFREEAKSFWSTNSDGAETVLGGAVSGFATRSSLRNIYTYTGAYNTVAGVEIPADTVIIQDDNRVRAVNKAKITDAMLGIDDTLTIQDGGNNTVLLHEALLDWASGVDVLDNDDDNDIADPRKVMGDPLHSQPAIVQYGEDSGVADLVAFVATNDGYLHAINANSGEELWAFIPQELLPLLNTNFENTVGQPKGYGLDGDVVALIDDVGKDGTITLGTDRVILYIGQRRGGNNIYAIDVTNRLAPSLLWVIKGGIADTAYEELGQTWSTVNVENIKSNGVSKAVLIFGGGYDTRHDNDDIAILPRVVPSSPLDPVRDDSIGRTVFIADALTGEIIWSAGKGGASPLANMDYSIPARVKPLDLSGDGNIDRLYVADLGGQLFRFDIDESALNSASFSAAHIKGGRIADLSKDNSLADARRFYYPPDVAIVAERGKSAYLGIAISSGYRAHPNNTDIHDRIFLLKDPYVFTAPTAYTLITESDLRNVTENTASLPDNATPAQIAASDNELELIDNAKGWYIELDDEGSPPQFIGEKGLAEPLIIEGSIIVTTFVPKTSAGLDACRPKGGSGKVFFLDIIDGTASYPTDADAREDRYRGLQKGGIPTSPNAIITTDAVPTICIGTECDPLGASIGLRKTFWYEVER